MRMRGLCCSRQCGRQCGRRSDGVLGVVEGIGRQFSRFGCACAPACGSVEPTHAAKARHEWGTRPWVGM